MAEQDEIKKLSVKFKKKIKKELDSDTTHIDTNTEEPDITEAPVTKEYAEFKKQYMPKHMTWYEKACNHSEKLLNVKPGPVDKKKLEEAIKFTHLDITPTGAMSLSILAPLALAFIGAFLGYLIPLLLTGESIFFFIFFFLFVAIIMINPLKQIPIFISNNWKLKASSQMVLCVFYIVTYMRHTSNLELAVEFASQHLSAPLNLDLRKVLWDVETEKYESMQESLETYLQRWKKTNLEFVEAMHLIEGSLLEGEETRRLSMLDKSLSVMLEETYEKMLHYAQNLQQPITMLNMLGIILPILGLVILPLVVSFMQGTKWYHIATMYNVFLPIVVYYLGKTILASRPSGYGEVDISNNPALKKRQNKKLFGIDIKPLNYAIIIGVIFCFIGLSPLMLHMINPNWDMIITNEGNFLSINSIPSEAPKYAFLEYKCPSGETCEASEASGPFGLGATLLSIAFTLGIGWGLSSYYKTKSANVMKIRNESKKLEKEFASALFQLGNRLGDGFPAEMAFGKVAETMEGTVSGDFFALVSNNIKRLGMSVEQAIFDPHSGALTKYPSDLIESSMKVLTESVKKGPKIAAQALVNISQYIKEMHKVNERLKDLMAENLSSIKGQIKFLTPSIAGIVIGITSMVTTILGKLTTQMTTIASESGSAGAGMGGLMDMFKTPSVPAYYFQIIVGLYVVQIVYILTVLANGIENGSDKLAERYELGKNLFRSVGLYCAISFIVILMFNLVASAILRG